MHWGRRLFYFEEVYTVTREERISQKPQWQTDMTWIGNQLFHTAKENLPQIRQIIEAYPGKLPEDREMRETAYLVLVRHLRDYPEPDYMRWHIAQVARETDRYILHYMLDEIANWPFLPSDTDIVPLLNCTKDPRWLVYEGAIEALSICDREEARQAVRPFLEREPIRKNEPVYGDLGRFFAMNGTPADLPVLEALYKRADRNIKYNLEYAITGIKKRYQKSK